MAHSILYTASGFSVTVCSSEEVFVVSIKSINAILTMSTSDLVYGILNDASN